MKDGESIIIRKVANGYQVMPVSAQNGLAPSESLLVFNDMGFASGTGESGDRDCLLKFVERHFSDTP